MPYQEGGPLCDKEEPTEVISNSDRVGSIINDGAISSRVVFTIRCPQSPLIPPEAPDVKSSDESETNISPDALGDASEAENQKQARLRRNKIKQGRRHRAHQQKEAWAQYKADLAEYNRRKSEREVEDRHASGKSRDDPYAKIQELAQELDAIPHPREEQERLQKILRTAPRQVQGRKTYPKQPDRAVSHRQNSQNQRKFAFERLGPSASSNKGSRGDQHRSNQDEQPRDYRSKPPVPTIP